MEFESGFDPQAKKEYPIPRREWMNKIREGISDHNFLLKLDPWYRGQAEKQNMTKPMGEYSKRNHDEERLKQHSDLYKSKTMIEFLDDIESAIQLAGGRGEIASKLQEIRRIGEAINTMDPAEKVDFLGPLNGRLDRRRKELQDHPVIREAYDRLIEMGYNEFDLKM